MINNSIADPFTKCPSWILTIQTFVQLSLKEHSHSLHINGKIFLVESGYLPVNKSAPIYSSPYNHNQKYSNTLLSNLKCLKANLHNAQKLLNKDVPKSSYIRRQSKISSTYFLAICLENTVMKASQTTMVSMEAIQTPAF